MPNKTKTVFKPIKSLSKFHILFNNFNNTPLQYYYNSKPIQAYFGIPITLKVLSLININGSILQLESIHWELPIDKIATGSRISLNNENNNILKFDINELNLFSNVIHFYYTDFKINTFDVILNFSVRQSIKKIYQYSMTIHFILAHYIPNIECKFIKSDNFEFINNFCPNLNLNAYYFEKRLNFNIRVSDENKNVQLFTIQTQKSNHCIQYQYHSSVENHLNYFELFNFPKLVRTFNGLNSYVPSKKNVLYYRDVDVNNTNRNLNNRLSYSYSPSLKFYLENIKDEIFNCWKLNINDEYKTYVMCRFLHPHLPRAIFPLICYQWQWNANWVNDKIILKKVYENPIWRGVDCQNLIIPYFNLNPSIMLMRQQNGTNHFLEDEFEFNEFDRF